MRNEPCFVVIIGSLLIASSVGPLAGQSRGRVTATIKVPGEASTIREAVEIVPDGGTILVASGTYQETLDIGKRVKIVGESSDRRPVIVGPPPVLDAPLAATRGIVNLRAGGSVLLKNLILVSGDVAVRGSIGADRVAPGEVEIEHVTMLRNGRGLAGGFSKLVLRDTVIDAALFQGAFINCFDEFEMANSVIANATEVGLYVITCDTFPFVTVEKSSYSYNGGGGAAFVGNMILDIEQSFFFSNRIFGVLVHHVPLTTINDSVVQGTIEGNAPLYYGLGDGLVAIDSTLVQSASSSFLANSRVGIMLANLSAPTAAALQQVVSTANRIGMVLQGANYFDNGGNSITGNIQQDIVGGGNLPVSGPPPLPQ